MYEDVSTEALEAWRKLLSRTEKYPEIQGDEGKAARKRIYAQQSVLDREIIERRRRRA